MKRMNFLVAALAAIAVLLASCGGGGSSTPPPDGFDRMAAVVLGANGAPLSNLQVRVEGVDTGVSTDSTGAFILRADQFPKGVQVENEISLGSNGIVVGSRNVVPVSNPDLVIRFDPGTAGGGTGSVSGSITDDKTGQGINNVEVTIFSEQGGVQSTKSSAGIYTFPSVPEGTWNIVANVDEYYPGMAMVRVAADETSIRNVELTRKGAVGNGDGIHVSGRLTDSKSGAGVSGATVSMMVDTGYYGIPEPMPMPVDDGWGSGGGTAGNVGSTEPGGAPDDPSGRDSSFAPVDDMWRYEPQYQETTTDADGNFSFPEDAAGYNVWISSYKDGYLNGSISQDIYGRTEDLEVEVSMDPLIMTGVNGTVVDDSGEPIKGAYVEYIFGGGFGGGGFAVPGAIDLDVIASDGMENFEKGSPTPPPSNSNDEGTAAGGWESPQADFAEGSTNAPGAGGDDSSDSDGSFDNNIMQRFRWEQQNSKGSSDVNAMFTGYYYAYTDEEGKFAFPEVPAGPYYVFVSAYRHVAYSADVTVEENEANNDVTITLPEIPVGEVTGTVEDENGTPLEDVLVNATQPNVDPFTYSDGSGHFTIGNIPAGEWTVSGYKSGYLTQSVTVEITDGGTASVKLVLQTYDAPDVTTGNMSGTVYDGYDDSTIAGADMVFTPTDNELGGEYFSHVLSDANGRFTTNLAQVEYNLLIQSAGYEDIFIRIWPEEYNREMDFWMWPIGAPGGGGGGGPVIIEPGFPGDDELIDPMPPKDDPIGL